MAKVAKESNEKVTMNLTEKIISVGNLFSQLGTAERSPGESFVLIKNNNMKTTGNGILAMFKYDDIGLKSPLVPIDAKMFFGREAGEYNIVNKKYSIDVVSKKRKSTIPLTDFDEWKSYNSRKNVTGILSMPDDEFIENFITYKNDEIVCKFILSKTEIEMMKKYQSYLGHKANCENFELFIGENNSIIVKIKDGQKNVKAEEFEIVDGVTVNNLSETIPIKVIFPPKYLCCDDSWVVTIFNQTINNRQSKKIIFEGQHEKITYVAGVEDSDEEIQNDSDLQNELSSLDDDFKMDESDAFDDDFGSEDFDD